MHSCNLFLILLLLMFSSKRIYLYWRTDAEQSFGLLTSVFWLPNLGLYYTQRSRFLNLVNLNHILNCVYIFQIDLSSNWFPLCAIWGGKCNYNTSLVKFTKIQKLTSPCVPDQSLLHLFCTKEILFLVLNCKIEQKLILITIFRSNLKKKKVHLVPIQTLEKN